MLRNTNLQDLIDATRVADLVEQSRRALHAAKSTGHVILSPADRIEVNETINLLLDLHGRLRTLADDSLARIEHSPHVAVEPYDEEEDVLPLREFAFTVKHGDNSISEGTVLVPTSKIAYAYVVGNLPEHVTRHDIDSVSIRRIQ